MKKLKIIVVIGYNNVGKTEFCTKFIKKYPKFKFYNQPELGLHPVLHGDLVNNIIEENKYSIIETHSEIITLRLRKLILKKVIKPEEVLIVYLSKDISNDMCITIDPEGTPSDWPYIFNENIEELLEMDIEINKRNLNIDNKHEFKNSESILTENINKIKNIRNMVRKNHIAGSTPCKKSD